MKGVAFNSSRRVGTPLPAVKVYNQREVDELLFLDIACQKSAAGPDFELVMDLGAECFVPLTVGGGISEESQVQLLLRGGADKVSINSEAYRNPDLIDRIAGRYGSQCVVVSIDVRSNGSRSWECFGEAGTKLTAKSVVNWAREVADRGAGEILLTSIDRDGTMTGYDLDLVSTVADAVSIPVIASGGAGSYQDMVDAVLRGGAAAVAASSMFLFTEQTPRMAKEFMAAAGIPVRLPMSN